MNIRFSKILDNREIVKNKKLIKKLLKLSHPQIQGGIKAVWKYAEENPSEVVIAFDDKEPIGVITMTDGRKNIYVHPDYRKKGIGKKLNKKILINKWELNESPDRIRDYNTNRVIAFYGFNDARPFLYDKNAKFHMSNVVTTHGELKKQIQTDTYFGDGRLWMKKKLISFWDYPRNQSELKDIAKDIKKTSGINIYSGGWKIDVTNITKKMVNLYNNISGFEDIEVGDDIQIPVEKYNIKTKKRQSDYDQHIQSPIKKNKKNVPKGVGSKKKKKHYWESLIKQYIKEELKK